MLTKLGYDKGLKVVTDIITSSANMSSLENKNDLRLIIKVNRYSISLNTVTKK